MLDALTANKKAKENTQCWEKYSRGGHCYVTCLFRRGWLDSHRRTLSSMATSYKHTGSRLWIHYRALRSPKIAKEKKKPKRGVNKLLQKKKTKQSEE